MMVAQTEDKPLPAEQDTCVAFASGTKSLPIGFGANRIRRVQQHPHQGPPILLLSQRAKLFLGAMVLKTLQTATNFDFEVEAKLHDPPNQRRQPAMTHHHLPRENQRASSSSSLQETCWTSQTRNGFKYIYLRYHLSFAISNLSDTAGITFEATTNPWRSTT
jgi:hypothetical protein